MVFSPQPIATPSPAPGNAPPKADLKQNVRDGEDGRRNLIELDGQDSIDDDGTGVATASIPATAASRTVPRRSRTSSTRSGKYRASLQVFDDRGTPSTTVTRGISVME